MKKMNAENRVPDNDECVVKCLWFVEINPAHAPALDSKGELVEKSTFTCTSAIYSLRVNLIAKIE